MKIIGHPFFNTISFKTIKSIDEIEHTSSKDILLFNNIEQDIEIIKYADINHLPFAIKVNSIKEAIFAHNLDAKYIFAPKDLAKEIQDIAQNYLFDTLILVEIDSEAEIERFAKLGIDGVLFSKISDTIQ